MIQSNLWTGCNTSNYNDIFQRNRNSDSTIYTEPQKTQNSQMNLEKQFNNKARVITLYYFKLYMYYRKTEIKIVHQHIKQKHKSTKQTIQSRSKPMQIQSTNLLQECQEQSRGKYSLYNKLCCKNQISKYKRPISYSNQKLKQIKDLM